MEMIGYVVGSIIILILIDRWNTWWEEQWIKKEIRK